MMTIITAPMPNRTRVRQMLMAYDTLKLEISQNRFLQKMFNTVQLVTSTTTTYN